MISAIDFLSGCVGGAAGVLIGHPFDTIKVIMQTNASKLSVTGVIRQSSVSSFRLKIFKFSSLTLFCLFSLEMNVSSAVFTGVSRHR